MSLYRKYRPQKFSDLVGQDHVKKTITNAIKTGKVSHGYLFSGPRGTGKTTVARLIAKSLNCLNPKEAEPCNDCISCKEILLDHSLDVIEIDAASNRGIDEIRELREKIKFAPSAGKYKIFIIDEVHMLTKEAFNALLKTLEEPPKHAIFIMATTELHKIPATILSRVQEFDFKRAKLENLTGYLKMISEKENIKIDDKALKMIALMGEGSYRDATSILDQVASRGVDLITVPVVLEILGIAEEKSVYEFIKFLAASDVKACFSVIDQLFYDGYNIQEFTKKLIEYMRKIMIYKSGNDHQLVDMIEEEKKAIDEVINGFETVEIIKFINLLIEASNSYKSSNLPQLPLELAVFEFCKSRSKGTVDTITEKQKVETIKPKEENSPKVIEKPEKASEVLVKKEIEKTLVENKEMTPKVENAPMKNVDSISIKEYWPKILEEIEPNNRSLYLILKESEPKEMKDERLVLGVKFKFYRERIENTKNLAALNEAMEKICGHQYPLECIVDSNIAPDTTDDEAVVVNDIEVKSSSKKNEDSDHLMGDAMEIFG